LGPTGLADDELEVDIVVGQTCHHATTALGIDIGGSGIKAGIVCGQCGRLVSQRTLMPTPQPATPDLVAAVVADIVGAQAWQGPVGVTFPGLILDGVAIVGVNLDPAWRGRDVAALLSSDRVKATVLNDADAAGLAEARFGAARGVAGVVIVLTFGSGIGSAMLLDGRLIPNAELGHLELDGEDVQDLAAAASKDKYHLSFEQWAARVEHYLTFVEFLFSPKLFVLGGGISQDHDQWLPYLHLRTPFKPAELRNDAGIIGAAMAALDGQVKAPA